MASQAPIRIVGPNAATLLAYDLTPICATNSEMRSAQNMHFGINYDILAKKGLQHESLRMTLAHL